jgi:hypothetical protein
MPYDAFECRFGDRLKAARFARHQRHFSDQAEWSFTSTAESGCVGEARAASEEGAAFIRSTMPVSLPAVNS